MITYLHILDCHVFPEVVPGSHFPPALPEDTDGYKCIVVLFVPSKHAPYALPIQCQKYPRDPSLGSAAGFCPGQ
jgi:hypothetical protein